MVGLPQTFPCGRYEDIEENHILRGGIFDYTTHGAANKTIGENKKILRYEIEEKSYEEGVADLYLVLYLFHSALVFCPFYIISHAVLFFFSYLLFLLSFLQPTLCFFLFLVRFFLCLLTLVFFF